MKVTLIIWISAIVLQEVEPGTLVRVSRDVGNLKSSLHTEYEANYKQTGKHGNDSFSTIKGNQEISHENCNDTWNEFAEKCAGLVKDLIASLANTISSSPGDATNLQLHIKNNFTHIDTSNKRKCFNRPPTCLSKLNFSSLFNNETGNILNKPNADAPLSVLTTLKKPDSYEEVSPNSVQPNVEDIILNNPAEDPKRSQQGSSLDYDNGSHMNPEEADALTGPQINNSRRQIGDYPTSQVEDSTTDPFASSKLPVIPSNTNGKPHVSFDPKDKSLEISAVPSNPPFNTRNAFPNSYFPDRMGNSENSFSEDPKGLGIADTPSESRNEFSSNLLDRKSSLSPKYTSQEASSEEEKYHTFLPPQSLVGEPLLGDSQQLHEEFESEEKPISKAGGDAHLEEKMPHSPTHPLPKTVNEEPQVPVIPHHPFIAPTTPSPLLLDTVLPSKLPSEDSQSKEPYPPQLSADHALDLPKTNEPSHSISHQDSTQEPISKPLHPIESQPIITDDSTHPILTPLSKPEKTPPEILPPQILNVEPPAKEVSHDENQPPSSHKSVPSSESTEPQILSFPQPSSKPLEASNHLSQKNTESAELPKELVLSEESPDDKSSTTSILLIPAPEPKEPISHFDKHHSPVENLEKVPHHDPHEIHEHPHTHQSHPHHHPDSTIIADKDDEKFLPEITHIPNVESEEKPSSPKRELAHPHPHPKVELVAVPVPEKELPPPPPPPPPKVELVPVPPPEKELPPPPPPHPKVELVAVPPPEKEHPPTPPPPPPKVELVPVPLPEKEHPPPPPPPPPKIELVPVPLPEKEHPPPPPPKVELVPVPLPEKEHPPPPPPPPPKVELVPVPPPEKEHPPPPPPPPPKVELVPVPLPEKEHPPPPPPPPPKVELVPVPPPEKEHPPPPPPKVELVPVPLPEKEHPPPPPPPPPKVELVPVPPPEKEHPPPPPPPPPKVELVPPAHKVPPPPPPPPPKEELVPVLPPEKELPPPPPPPPPKVELVPPAHKVPPPPPPKVELVAVPVPEKELPPPPPPKVELVPVPVPEKELPPPPPPKVELVPVPVPEKELPPPPPPKVELVPVSPPEKELPPPPPPKVELVPVPVPEKELPPPPPPPPPKVELVAVPVPEKELPPPPPPPPPKVELVPVPPPEKELPPPPPPPPPKVELVPVPVPEKELPPPPPHPPRPPPKIKLVPISSVEQNEIPSHDLKDDKASADMPWPPHAPYPPHHHHPHHHPPPHQPHHPPHRKEEVDDDSAPYSAEVRVLEEEKQPESEKATTFQTTSADPTPPESSLSYPPFFMPNPTSQAPPPLTLPNSEAYPMIPSTTTFETVPESKQEYKEDSDEYDEDCCSCESCTDNNEKSGITRRVSACQDLEQARKELKEIFDKIQKKLKCGRKTQKPTITT